MIGEQRVPGVIGMKPVHLTEVDERNQVPPIRSMYIDIGVNSREKTEKLVKVGDYAVFATRFEPLAEGNLRAVKGKAFDDRAGCAMLVELLQERYRYDLYGVFTVQEEVGLRGARVAAYRVAPDLSFSLEGTICDDLPKKRDVSPVTRVGGGPVITIMDRSVIVDKRLVKLLVDSAEELGIPYQFKQMVAGGTDAGAIHLARAGIPSAVVAVPSRYIHSAVGLVSLADYDQTVQLMRKALHNLEGGLPS